LIDGGDRPTAPRGWLTAAKWEEVISQVAKKPNSRWAELTAAKQVSRQVDAKPNSHLQARDGGRFVQIDRL
jgi:hypothetical protein